MSIDTDRVALSNELYELSDRFLAEIDHWKDINLIAELGRNARLLAELARHALTIGDLTVADAYARSADLSIRRIQSNRKAIENITYQPRVRQP